MWDRSPRFTWSGTPWQLREALRARVELVDLPSGPPVPLRAVLKAAGMRHTSVGWRSIWRYNRTNAAWTGRDLRRVAPDGLDVVVQIQDLGIPRLPYLLVQDLSYSLLLRHYGAGGVPHFRGLSRRRIIALRERQLEIYSSAAALLPMSRWLADDLIASGVPADRVHVVNPGINVGIEADAPIPTRRSGPRRRLLFVGRDFETKGGPQVVAAFAELRRRHGPTFDLTIIGPALWPLRGGVPDGVSFVGPAPTDVVAAAMDDHDLFVVPSQMEGFGMAFAEALVRGLPVVARNACAMPEIVTPGDGGLLVGSDSALELADLIEQALADDSLYAACAAAAPRRRAHYTWDRAAAQVLDAIGSVLG